MISFVKIIPVMSNIITCPLVLVCVLVLLYFMNINPDVD